MRTFWTCLFSVPSSWSGRVDFLVQGIDHSAVNSTCASLTSAFGAVNVPNEIEPVQEQLAAHVEGYTSGLLAYLDAIGLPSTDVVVKTSERRLVVGLVPEVIANLTPAQRSVAQYLSKFVAACVAGLFDAALNYLWDETVRCLRAKVMQFDLDYFFDTAIKDPTERQKYTDETDLAQIPDYKLIEGCRDIGIISALAKRHMDYIRDMRNHASAAHPNQNEIHGIQLSGWLQTCLEEVIVREPEAPAIEAAAS